MPPALTIKHARSILDPAERGNWEPFARAIDPDVRWWISSDEGDEYNKAGVYNFASWKKDVNIPLLARLRGGVLRMRTDSLDVVGLKAIAECSGFAVQNNGKPYMQRFAWFLIFSPETGKIVEIHEYMHTALTQEVFRNN